MTRPIEVLLVEDDERSRVTVQRFLEDSGYQVTAVPDGEQAEEAMKTRPFSVAIVDYRLPRRDGITLIKQFKTARPAMPCILITAHGDVQSAVRAMKAGAFQFLEKPIAPNELAALIQEACKKEELAFEVEQLRRQLNERYGFENIIGRSPLMHRVFEQIRLVAPTHSTVLILGESGTGKELVARAIHQNSPRKDGPFVAINCAALPSELAESELFGHERGAFTGAVAAKPGYFEAASGGTLLVDEISEMPLSLQPKLLRVLEQRVVTRVGSTRETPVDVRVIAASNRRLDEAAREGAFRQDLFYRLAIVWIDLPPLRDRGEDIPLLVSTFLRELNAQHGRHVEELAPDALAALHRYSWPGNVRELRNTLESMVVLTSKRRLDAGDLPPHLRLGTAAAAAAVPLPAPTLAAGRSALVGRSLAEIEKEAILGALDACGGNRTRAAQMLGIAVRTIQRKLADYGVAEE
jgi:DNA-binding NtrC family response regulator